MPNSPVAFRSERTIVNAPELTQQIEPASFAPEDPAVAELQNPTGLTVSDRVASFGSAVVNFGKKKTALALAATLGGGAMAPAVASAGEVVSPPAITSLTTETKVTINGSTQSQEDMSKTTILAFNKQKGMSKSTIVKLRKKNSCYKLPVGKKFVNSGRDANGRIKYFNDTAKAGQNEFCRENGKTRKVNCNNEAFTGKVPSRIVKRLLKGKVILVRSHLNTPVSVTSTSSSKAEARCGSGPFNYALAYGAGSGYASARLTVKSYLSARGRSIITSQRIAAELEANTKSKAQAEVACSDNPTGPGDNSQYPKPETRIFQPEHMNTSGIAQICEEEFHPDSSATIVNRKFDVAVGGGNFVGPITEKFTLDPNTREFCQDYKAPTTPTAPGAGIILKATVFDNRGQSNSSPSNPFPIVDIPK